MNKLKSLASIRTTFLAVLLIGSITSSTVAKPRMDKDEKVDKVTLKTREAVSKASPDDWYTLALAADKCIKRGVNLTEANQWIDKSLQIKETSYNLCVKGDYYVSNRLPEKAMDYYVRSIEVGKTENPNFDASEVQKKIAAIVLNK